MLIKLDVPLSYLVCAPPPSFMVWLWACFSFSFLCCFWNVHCKDVSLIIFSISLILYLISDSLLVVNSDHLISKVYSVPLTQLDKTTHFIYTFKIHMFWSSSLPRDTCLTLANSMCQIAQWRVMDFLNTYYIFCSPTC